MNTIRDLLRGAAFPFIVPALLLSPAALSGVVNSKHDLSAGMGSPAHGAAQLYNAYGQVCVYCHTPHAASGQTTRLWNRNLSTANYILYTSPTFIAMPLQSGISPPILPEQPGSGPSSMCLSCHDGTIAVDAILRTPLQSWVQSPTHQKMLPDATPGACGQCHNTTSPEKAAAVRHAFIGTDLSDDHPVGIAYQFVNNPDFRPIASVLAAGLKFYDGKMECATCHDPHQTTYGSFLRKANVGSSLCQTCHDK